MGAWADKYPESVKAIADSGCEVMNHSDDHAHFSKLTSEQITANINSANDKIEAATGTRPVLFRCPYSEYDDHVITAVNAMGMKAVQWNVDSLDWQGISAKEITGRVLKNVKPGSIILFHNAAKNTPEALPGILESLIADGYSIVPVSQLLLAGDCTIDSTGCQRPLATGTASPAVPSAGASGAAASPAASAAQPPSGAGNLNAGQSSAPKQ